MTYAPQKVSDLSRIALALERLASATEASLPPALPVCDFAKVTAARWRRKRGSDAGYLDPVLYPHKVDAKALVGIARQKKLIDQNTAQFVADRPANNVLLTGSRGTGKSSLVKAMLAKYAKRGLRLIEVEKDDLGMLPDIVDQIAAQPFRFVLFCDDLSFDAGEAGYKALKAILDGSIAAPSPNVLIYATSNRRHLLPEYMSENLETKYVGEEIHPGESVEEKISLSERFGLWISFYPFSQDEYLEAVVSWIAHFGQSVTVSAIEHDALQWALQRGSRSGRVAWQYAKDFCGRAGKS